MNQLSAILLLYEILKIANLLDRYVCLISPNGNHAAIKTNYLRLLFCADISNKPVSNPDYILLL